MITKSLSFQTDKINITTENYNISALIDKDATEYFATAKLTVNNCSVELVEELELNTKNKCIYYYRKTRSVGI